jgi:hypothetical protein
MLSATLTGTGGQDDEMDMGTTGIAVTAGGLRRGESAHTRGRAADGVACRCHIANTFDDGICQPWPW